jgi:CheY-like chemotaxis protein
MMTLPAPTALIVDDDYFSRDVCALALEHVGFQVFQAADGLEALEALHQRAFDLLILDLLMPEADGIEVLRELRETRLHPSMPIIITTANVRMAAHELVTAVDSLIYKPIDINEFSQLARRLIERKLIIQ